MAEKLALDGGDRVVPEGMVKAWPPMTQQDKDAVLAVFDSGHLHGSSAPRCLELQERWAEYCGAKYCVVTNSGTAACHMAVATCGVEPGDEVIVPAFTFWSTAAAVLHHNAIPVFVDIDPKTYTIDPKLIEAKITKRTKAIFPVDIHGMPCDMDPIFDIARKHNLKVISDCCQAHGAKYKGRKVGSIADATAFSCNRSKNLSGGEGGLYTTNNEAWAKHATMMREFGEVVVAGQPREYNAFGLGWMYRPHEFINAFILSQLTRLDQHNAVRKEFAAYLTEQLAQIPGVKGPYTPDYADPVYFSYVVEFRPQELGLDVPVKEFKNAVIKALRAEGVGLGQWQTMPVPGQSVFQEKKGYGKGCPWTCQFGRDVEYRAEDYPRTIEFIESHSYLSGVYPPNTMELMERYVRGFRKVIDNIDRVMELARE
ncbi:MAG TPA: DegT/DnrJ/EryC1/StrS family aminotransferase [Armatimonadota bacterium]|nr:DegT/DnrJ/EryC1/StrS family aminotransferase [Armatimonadota bacterium]HOM80322.1 DegT/DnrJ/EryC1/StrS family aminotransferase [Armatimonadota bacterium]HOQ29618.1 DegT/DnrJ/EryC1/StrS family aminotransferase [Armatimonadota bacterium]HPO71841.1 DegT/DnrJ/EryC1/StrS family aminotransferase [Armatimonadota bacterium]HPT99785.1 DegT/DnrJ/EryC1/StrS family aminotransferase [Armatimonadota bacterium]